MTREEEIAKYCEDMGFPLGSCSSINSIKALTASDAIERACEWLDSNFLLQDNVGSWYKEGFIKQFKKAMKGE